MSNLRFSNRRTFTTALGAAAGFLVSRGQAFGQTAKPVIGALATADDAITPVLYAKSSGMFDRAGLDVSIARGTGGAAVTAAVVSGSYNVGHASVIALMNAHLQNVPVTIIAPGAYFTPQNPYAGLLVSKDAPISSGKDLNGKIVACATLGDLAQVAISSWVEQHGGDWRTLKFVEVPMSAAGAAIEQGRIVAASVTEPFLDAALDRGNVKMLGTAYASIGTRYLFSAWFTTVDWATKNPEVVRTFNAIVQQAGAYSNAHHAETAPILGQFSGVPASVYDHLSQRAYAGTSLSGTDLQPLIDKAARYNVIPRSFPGAELIAPQALKGA